MPFLSIDPVAVSSDEDIDLKMSDIEYYVEISLTMMYKENDLDTFYKFPFKNCDQNDFSRVNFTIPKWYHLKKHALFCPGLT